MLFGHIIFIIISSAVCMAATLRGGIPDSVDHDDRDLATVCTNTVRRGGIDRGCTNEFPICVSSKGRNLFYGLPGGLCAKCMNLPRNWPVLPWQQVKYGTACPTDRPLCIQDDYTEPRVRFAGMMCIDGNAVCYNNNADLLGVDYKCSAAKPVCVKADGSKTALHNPGDQCIHPWHVYSTNDDFINGNTVLVNVNTSTLDQLDLKGPGVISPFLWIPVTSPGTLVKIDTTTGAVVGRYKTWPSLYGDSGYPAALSLDNDGSVWVANVNNYNGSSSIIHIGLKENDQCEDRNGNGIIDTSTGLNDVKAWVNDSGTRRVATADDECIVHFLQVTSSQTQHVTVNAENDVWVSGTTIRNFDLIKGGRYNVTGSGTITKTYPSVNFGGYGGLVDGYDVVWSTGPSSLLRWDPDQPLNGTNGAPAGGLDVGPPLSGTTWAGKAMPSQGLCSDRSGSVWATAGSASTTIMQFASDGKHLNTYNTGGIGAFGCIVDPVTGDIWVTNYGSTTASNTVSHLKNNGTLLGTVTVESRPTGVAVDRTGKVWVVSQFSRNVMRIDPALNGGVGGVDLTLSISDISGSVTVSDMTGSRRSLPPRKGTWTVTHDSNVVGQMWGMVTWTAVTPLDAGLTVQARSSTDGITYSVWESVSKLVNMTVPNGRYLQVRVNFFRATTGESPILHDISISPAL